MRFRLTAPGVASLSVAAVLVTGALLCFVLHFLSSRRVVERERRLEQIDTRLQRISTFAFRNERGAVGYSSNQHDQADDPVSVMVDWKQERSIDQIVLVPVILRSEVDALNAYGFPVEFDVVCGGSGEAEGEVIASFHDEDGLLPRLGPLVVPCPAGTMASWVRIDVRRMSLAPRIQKCIFVLSEIMVFSGPQNVALAAKVSEPKVGMSSGQRPQILRDRAGSWSPEHLVDGHMPYVMDSNTGRGSGSLVSTPLRDEPVIVSIDLGSARTIDAIQLHKVHDLGTIPLTMVSRRFLPFTVRLEAALNRDFSDAVTLAEYDQPDDKSIGPIIMRNIEPTPCRYLRLTGTHEPGKLHTFGLAELELYAGDRNVALGAAVDVSFKTSATSNDPQALTDGSNDFGIIIPMRQWLGELSERHDLQGERTILDAELGQLYTRQRYLITALFTIVALLVMLLLAGAVLAGVMRQRIISQTREKIAADLHDELNANLHGISLIGELAEGAADSPEDLRTMLRHLRTEVGKTIQSTRCYTNLLDANDFRTDLAEEFPRLLSQLLPELDTAIRIEDREVLESLDGDTRLNLFLFFKECMVNVIRHARATSVRVSFGVDRDRLVLTVEDDGVGMPVGSATPARSLQRRARYLRGKASFHVPESGGTGVRLELVLPKSCRTRPRR